MGIPYLWKLIYHIYFQLGVTPIYRFWWWRKLEHPEETHERENMQTPHYVGRDWNPGRSCSEASLLHTTFVHSSCPPCPSTSSLLANVSLKCYNVYPCLSAPPAAPGCLSHWLLWSNFECSDVIIHILNIKYQTCLILVGRPMWVLEQFRKFWTESVNHSHYQWWF